MKKIKFIIAVSLLGLFFSCAKTPSASVNGEMVAKFIADKEFLVQANTMDPEVGGAIPLTDTYFVEVLGDTVISHLPYIGMSYDISPSSSVLASPLKFKAKISDYKATTKRESKRKTVNIVTFTAATQEKEYKFRMEIANDGRTYFSILPDDRDLIGFNGQIVPRRDQR